MNSPEQSLQSLKIVHFAFIAAQVIFAVVAYFTRVENIKFDLNDTDNIFLIIAPMLAIGGFLASNFIYKKRLEKIAILTDPNEKIKESTVAHILRIALIEGPSLFSIVAFLLSGNLFFILISCVLVLYQFTFIPTKEIFE